MPPWDFPWGALFSAFKRSAPQTFKHCPSVPGLYRGVSLHLLCLLKAFGVMANMVSSRGCGGWVFHIWRKITFHYFYSGRTYSIYVHGICVCFLHWSTMFKAVSRSAGSFLNSVFSSQKQMALHWKQSQAIPSNSFSLGNFIWCLLVALSFHIHSLQNYI